MRIAICGLPIQHADHWHPMGLLRASWHRLPPPSAPLLHYEALALLVRELECFDGSGFGRLWIRGFHESEEVLADHGHAPGAQRQGARASCSSRRYIPPAGATPAVPPFEVLPSPDSGRRSRAPTP